jgi:two-component system sensor kinase FixL
VAIWLSYVAIPIVLVYFTRHRRDLPFPWMFWMFGAFIIGCGTTHLMEVITSVTPVYRVAGLIKLLTAAVSLATAVALVPLVPKALALRSPKELETENRERKRAEDLLRQSEERFRGLLESAPDAMVIVRKDGRIALVNKQAELLFGYARTDLLGQAVEMLVPERLRSGHPQHRDGYFANPSFRPMGAGLHLYGRRKDGTEFPVEISLSPIMTEEGLLVSSAIRDITERKKSEEQMRAFAERLARSNRELEQFASVASHDLQEPLRKIQTFGDRLQAKGGDALDEQSRDYLQRMQNAAERMRTLINDLLAFSRLTTKVQPFVPVDLGPLVYQVVSDLEGRIQQTGGRLEVGELPTVLADPVQMRQLFQNLIANGLKFHRPGTAPVVRVTGKIVFGEGSAFVADARHGSRCEITVADNGIGFQDTYRERIFEVFQRLHGRDQYEGSGMGLAICRKIVERHGGSISAHSTPAHGATFVITLPLTEPQEDTSHEQATPTHHDLDGRR